MYECFRTDYTVHTDADKVPLKSTLTFDWQDCNDREISSTLVIPSHFDAVDFAQAIIECGQAMLDKAHDAEELAERMRLNETYD